MEIIFFVVALVAALFTVGYVISIKKGQKKDVPPKTVFLPPESGVIPLNRAVSHKEVPPANVAILYEGCRSCGAKHCKSCGCEYASSVTICEICGEEL